MPCQEANYAIALFIITLLFVLYLFMLVQDYNNKKPNRGSDCQLTPDQRTANEKFWVDQYQSRVKTVKLMSIISGAVCGVLTLSVLLDLSVIDKLTPSSGEQVAKGGCDCTGGTNEEDEIFSGGEPITP